MIVKAGELSRVRLGGTGRTVIGQARLPGASGPINWPGVLVQLRSLAGAALGRYPQREDFASARDYIAANQRFVRISDAQRHYDATCSAGGSFRVADVPAGRYELKITMRDFKLNSVVPHDLSDRSPVIASLTRTVVVPAGASSDPIDLGALGLVPRSATASLVP